MSMREMMRGKKHSRIHKSSGSVSNAPLDDYPIDIVVPWVDGADPAWRAEHDKYTASSTSDNSSARYRDWELFKYWFRGVEQYAPWVNKVFLVTYGHLPAWLNTEHPKLVIVNHKDYIPEKYLPTFSSHVIELNMHRIPGLSEHFLYFNDDVYLTQPTGRNDFFRDGVPLDTAVFGIVKNTDTTNYMPYIMLNMLAVINEHFSKREMIRKNPGKWLTLKNGKGLLNTLYLMPWSSYTGFRNYHTCVSYCKSTFEKVWKEVPDILDQTCSHKFRSKEDVNQYLMRYWQLCEGNFEPRKQISDYITINGEKTSEHVRELMNDARYKVVCVNDDPMGFDFETEKKKMIRVFEEKYPEKSSFEL